MKKVLFLLFALCIAGTTWAQFNYGGTPYSIAQNLNDNSVPLVNMPAVNMSQINAQDVIADANGEAPRIAVNTSVNLNLNNSGVWYQLPNGDRVWKLRIKSKYAEGLFFTWDNFYLPPGAELYIYSKNREHVLGSYTDINNQADGKFINQILPGEEAIVEYYEPATVQNPGHFTINNVYHAYRETGWDRYGYAKDFGDSDPSCEVNVNCTPEGNNWQDEKRGVARILVVNPGGGAGWCSGSMITNTAADCKPLFLFAFHCGTYSTPGTNYSHIYYFNYEAPGCSNPGSQTGLNTDTWNQSVCRSHSNDGGGNSGSDYLLTELTGSGVDAALQGYNVYWNGFDATVVSSGTWTNGVSIHHPAGDIKKISTYTAGLISTQWGSATGSHWRVTWISTTNGHGVTEGGSSGSAIFNSAGRIVGSLTGGSSYCATPNNPDQYGKMSYHWNSNSNPSGGHLSTWLDPGNTGTLVMDGSYAPCTPVAPTCNFSASATTVVAGGSVNYTDNSSGVPTSWNWVFNGGTPGTSTSQNPSGITYGTPGTYWTIFTATNAQGSCTDSIQINVTASTGCDTLSNFGPTDTLTVYNSPNGGFVTGVNGYGDLAKAEYYSGYAPYTHINSMLAYIFGAQDGGNGSTVNFNVWDNTGTGGTPGAVLGSVSVLLSDIVALQNNNQVFLQVDFPTPVNVGGNPFYLGLDLSGLGAGDTLGIVSNQLTDPTPNSAWEQWSNNSWNDMETAWGAGPFTMFIQPLITDAPVTGTATATTSTTVCEGGSVSFDGSTSNNVSNYVWIMNGGTPALDTLNNSAVTTTYNTAGTYMTYLVAEGSCAGQAIDSVQVTVTAGAALTTNSTDPGCGSNNGSITITASGGTPGYTYSIDNGVTFVGSGAFTGLGAGTYDIVVQDANGCQSTDQAILNTAGGATVASAGTDPGCAGNDGQIVITATGGTPTYQYSIDNGVTYQAGGTFTSLAAGTYNIVVLDNNGCTTNDVVTLVNSGTNPSVSNAAVDPNCGANDGSITITASGGNGPYTYSIDGGVTFQASGTFTNLGTGSYNIVVQDQSGCQGTDVASLANTSGPSLAESHNDVSCGGASDGDITITGSGGSGGLQYSIDGGVTFQGSGSFTGLAGGTYDLVVQDGNGCQDVMQITIIEPAAVLHNAAITNAACGNSNGSIAVTASGGQAPLQYSIDGGVTYQAGNSFTGLAQGTYQVLVQDANGCTSAQSAETVGGSAAITLASSNTNETCGNANGTATVTPSGGSGTFTYLWSSGGTNPTETGLAAGTYSVTVTDNNGCAEQTTVTITNQGGVNGTVSSDATICAGGTEVLTATGGSTYSWVDGGGNTVGSSSTIAVTPNTTTVYTVTITDNFGCTEQLNVTVTVNSTPVTTLCCNTTICAGETLTLVAGGGTSYFWNTTETAQTIDVSPTNQTTYSVIAYNGPCAGPLETVTVAVDPSATASANASALSGPVGTTINFNNTGSVGTSYSWDFGDGSSSTNPSDSHTYNIAGTYTVILTSNLGNCPDSDTLIITIGVVGLEDSELGTQIGVFPNPSSGLVNIAVDFNAATDVTVEVYDYIGKLVETFQNSDVTSDTYQVNLTDKADGVYMIRVQAGDETLTRRVLIAR